MKNRILSIVSITILIILWKLISEFIGSEIILPSPESVFKAFITLAKEKTFIGSVSTTICRGVTGFIISASVALVVGIAAGENKYFYNLIKPLLTIIKTVPVLSIILLAIIWLNTDDVPVFVCFLVVFPIISANVIQGIKNVAPGLLQMAKIYRVSRSRIIIQIYLPSLIPYLMAGLSTAAGVTWKAVIAAEVICMPKAAIGTGMQYAKLQLNTEDLFAWTFIAIIISALSEIILLLFNYLFPWRRK